jgi:hypothetical protein
MKTPQIVTVVVDSEFNRRQDRFENFQARIADQELVAGHTTCMVTAVKNVIQKTGLQFQEFTNPSGDEGELVDPGNWYGDRKFVVKVQGS